MVHLETEMKEDTSNIKQKADRHNGDDVVVSVDKGRGNARSRHISSSDTEFVLKSGRHAIMRYIHIQKDVRHKNKVTRFTL